jgi:hypothetical protein
LAGSSRRGCLGRRRGGRLGGCGLWAKSGGTLGYTEPQAAQALVLGAATVFLFALLASGFARGNTFFLGAALRIDARLLLGLTTIFFFGAALGFGFLLALFFLAAALLFLGAALFILLFAVFFLARLALGLVLLDEGHHLTDVLVLDVGTRARLDGDTVLLRDGKDVLALHLNGLGQLVNPHSNPRLGGERTRRT